VLWPNTPHGLTKFDEPEDRVGAGCAIVSLAVSPHQHTQLVLPLLILTSRHAAFVGQDHKTVAGNSPEQVAVPVVEPRPPGEVAVAEAQQGESEAGDRRKNASRRH
jgi:hypothetical protein